MFVSYSLLWKFMWSMCHAVLLKFMSIVRHNNGEIGCITNFLPSNGSWEENLSLLTLISLPICRPTGLANRWNHSQAKYSSDLSMGMFITCMIHDWTYILGDLLWRLFFTFVTLTHLFFSLNCHYWQKFPLVIFSASHLDPKFWVHWVHW